MNATELREALGSLVQEHGFRRVARLLREMEPKDRHSQSARERTTGSRTGTVTRNAAQTNYRPSAAEYVARRELTPTASQTRLLARAARAFDERAFLPTLDEVRRFGNTYGMKPLRARSRSTVIPRVFQFLASMDPAEVVKILDDELFAGPTRLGPISDAIHRRAQELREIHPPPT